MRRLLAFISSLLGAGFILLLDLASRIAFDGSPVQGITLLDLIALAVLIAIPFAAWPEDGRRTRLIGAAVIGACGAYFGLVVLLSDGYAMGLETAYWVPALLLLGSAGMTWLDTRHVPELRPVWTGWDGGVWIPPAFRDVPPPDRPNG